MIVIVKFWFTFLNIILSILQKGYEELQMIVPTCQQVDNVGSQKLSKATILQRCKLISVLKKMIQEILIEQ